ncbi:MAG: hypothetical protein PUF46_03745 [Oscillospiraceae bacterium]|nr:hypothetical protein [Oscillospiraceae bacterium]
MTDKELKRMSRAELLQMLITQVEENQSLQARLEATETQLKDRSLAVSETGTMAEAALSLNGVFQAADAAAQQYLDNIRQMQERQELLYQEAEDEAKRNADAIVAEADAYSRKAHADADAYWEEVRARVDSLLREQESLRSLIQSSGPAGTV